MNATRKRFPKKSSPRRAPSAGSRRSARALGQDAGIELPENWEIRLCELELLVSQLELERVVLRRACDPLREEQIQKARALEVAPLGWVQISPLGKILALNLAASLLLGQAKPGLLNHSFADQVASPDRETFLAFLRQCRTSQRKVEAELQMRALDQLLPVHLHMRQSLDPASGKLRIEIFLRSLVQRQQVLEYLAESEQNLRVLIETSPHPIQFKDIRGRWIIANRAMLDLFHLVGVDYQRKTDAELAQYSPLYRASFEACARLDSAALRLGKMSRMDCAVPQPDDSSRIVDFIRVPYRGPGGKLKGLVVLGYDVTRRHASEATLRASEERYRSVVKALPDLMFRLSAEGVYLDYHAERSSDLAVAPERIIGLNIRESGLPSAFIEQALGAISQVLKTGKPQTIEYSLSMPHGLRNYEARIVPCGHREVVAIVRDITERKKAELERAQLAAIVTTSADAIFSETLEGRIENWNKAAEKLFGYAQAEIRGKPITLLFPAPARAAVKSFDERLRRGESIKLFETVCLRKDGTSVPVALSLSAVRDGLGHISGKAIIARDITERKSLETGMLQAAEREQHRIGQDLHDGLGQQLTALELMGQSLKADLLGSRPDLRQKVDTMCRCLRQAVRHARLLAYGLAPFKTGPGGLEAALAELAANVSAARLVRCRFSCSKSVIPQDAGIANHCYRIAQEALQNALKHGQPDRIDIRLKQKRQAIQLVISDNGRGFVKTKSARPGIGLQAMRHRASVMGGQLKVVSSPGQGTTVTCSIPVAS